MTDSSTDPDAASSTTTNHTDTTSVLAPTTRGLPPGPPKATYGVVYLISYICACIRGFSAARPVRRGTFYFFCLTVTMFRVGWRVYQQTHGCGCDSMLWNIIFAPSTKRSTPPPASALYVTAARRRLKLLSERGPA